jgi:hypothetical protein
MNYKEKYLKYKNKYVLLKKNILSEKNKNIIGGKYIVGNQNSNKLIDSNLTLIQAHGGIDITRWYALPENVYLMTTSEIGGITCANYNEVFRELINDTNDRENLKKILETVSETNSYPKNKIVKTIYRGGNIIYEPGDLIPIITLEFNNSIHSDAANSIYGLFNFDPIKTEDKSKNILLEEYINLIKTGPNTELIMKNSSFEIRTKFNKNKLIKLIKSIDKKSINLELAFNKFLLNQKYKKYFAEPDNLDFDTVRDNDDNKFLTMILTLLYKSETDKNKYTYTIKDIIDNLDKTKVNLIVLTSCLHAKNVYMRIFNTYNNLPSSLNEYNDKTSINQIAGEYFSNSSILPVYTLTSKERESVSRLMEIYKNWDENKNEIINLLEEEITLNGLSENNNLNKLLYDCIYNNFHQVMSLLRNSFQIEKKQLVSVLKEILASDMIKSNLAFDEYFKINVWHQSENINIEYETLYLMFEKNSKISLWDVLTDNKFKWYYYNNYNEWTCVPIIKKLTNSYENTENIMNISDEEKIRLVKSYFTNNAQEELLTYLINNYFSINPILSNKMMELDSLILLSINNNNYHEFISNIYDENFFKSINNILGKNNFYIMSPIKATELLIKVFNPYKIYIILEITKWFKDKNIDINAQNNDGYNLYSYIVASHDCSIIRARKNEYGSNDEQITQSIAREEEKFKEILKKLESLGFEDNGRKLNLSLVPENFKGLEYNLKIDGIICKNCAG